MSWCHIIISHNFIENITSFFFCVSPFAAFLSEHIACRPCFLQCTIGSQIKQVWSKNSVAKLTASARWGLLKMVDNHFLWHQLDHRLLALYFQLCDVCKDTFGSGNIFPVVNKRKEV